MAKKDIKIYTVTQVNALIKLVLEESLPSTLVITAEISDFKRHHSGHCYFVLKDENAQLPAVMWDRSFRKLKFTPENGTAVIATGHIDVYTPGGKYQFYVDTMQPAGVGALQLAFEQMVRKLRQEGLFSEEHKKALPEYPSRIAILTSESGAAIHDITESIWKRWPATKLFVCPVPVQGEGAAEQIAAAIRNINKKNRSLGIDLLIVGRGGGSLEDLWAFNEEVLARAIFNSRIPIISAVGHEVDTTIADLVADARASTPTKAGVIAVPDINEVGRRLESIEESLKKNVRTKLELISQQLEIILASMLFRDPKGPLLIAAQRLDEMQVRLSDSIKTMLARLRETISGIFAGLTTIEPHRLIAKKAIELNNLHTAVLLGVQYSVKDARILLTAQENRLVALNPRSVLKRGYSITINKRTGDVLTDIKALNVGDLIVTELAERNLVESQVKKLQNISEEGNKNGQN
ncbi:MAG: exodeoxyribonuclease VII large subunit [Planctomycetota bacterium]